MSQFPPEEPESPPPASPPPGGYPPPSAPPPGGYQQPPPGYGPPPPGYGAPEQGYGAPQPGYGAPQQGGYGNMPGGYGQAPGPAPAGTYADWPKRALSGLIDSVGPFFVAAIIFFAAPKIGWLFYLAAIAWALYNAYLGGQTGQSYGKKIAGTRLLSEQTGQPIGGGLGIGRAFVHIIDGIPCYVGYLWPLWDPKRQTFADKILNTIVVPV